MKSLRHWCALGCVALGLSPLPSMATDYLMAEGTYVHPDRDRADNYGEGGGIFAGFCETDWLAIETGFYAAGMYSHAPEPSDAHVLTGMEVAVKARAAQYGPASLFFRTGAGVEYAKPGSAAKFSPALSPGLGIQYRLSRAFSVLFAADERFTFGSPGNGRTVDHDLWASVGVVMDLPHARAVAEIPEAPARVVPAWANTTREVHFAFDSANLTDEAQKDIADLAALLKGSQTLVVELRGNADSVGDPFYNLSLARRRAEAVRDALVATGVAPSRIATHTDGEYVPADSNATPEGRAENRRDVVLIYEGIPETK